MFYLQKKKIFKQRTPFKSNYRQNRGKGRRKNFHLKNKRFGGILRLKRQEAVKRKLLKFKTKKNKISFNLWKNFSRRFLNLKKKSELLSYSKSLDLVFWKRITINKISFTLGKRLFLLKKLRISSKKKFSPNRRLIMRVRRAPFWVLAKSSEKRFLYYYGFFQKNVFNRFVRNLNIRKKEKFFAMYLEFTLISFLFKLSFFSSTLEIFNSIKLGWFSVNGGLRKTLIFV